MTACSAETGPTTQQTSSPWARPTIPVETPALPPLKCVDAGSDTCVATLDSDALFPTGSAILSSGSLQVADQLATLVKSRGSYVQLVGHADGQGEYAANLTLSEARADAIKQALIERGISESSISTCGVGDQGAAPGVDDQAFRRVDAILTQVLPGTCPMR